MLSAQLPNLLRGALHRIAVPARIDEHHVDQLNPMVEFFESSDWLFGGGMSRNAAGQLEWCCEVLARSSMSDRVRQVWQSSTARLAELAGFMLFDCGGQLAARRFFLVALQLAAEAQALGRQGEVAAAERAVGPADDLFAQRAATSMTRPEPGTTTRRR